MSILTSSCHLAVILSCVGALIIPEELPSILSVIYSNIPPIKKGTDSRVGVGFRLGEHADFQVLLELGPQTYTQPIGPNADSKKRRQIQRPHRPSYTASSTDIVGDTPGGKWLSSWKSGFVNPKEHRYETVGVQEIMNPLIGKEHVASHLQQLYKQTQQSSGRSNDNVSNLEPTNVPDVDPGITTTVAAITTSSSAATSEEPITESS